MKLKLLVLLFAFCSTVVEAQHISKFASVKWGPELEGSKKGSITDFLGYDDNAFYLSAYEKSDQLIEKLDKNLGNPQTLTFEEKDKATKEKFEFHSRLYFSDKLYILKTAVDKDTKTTILYAEEINKKTMASKGKLKKISEITYEKRRDKGGFGIITSPNENYLMVVENIPTENEENEQFNVAILDTAMNLVWKKHLELPYVNTLFFRQNSMIGDDGNIYVLGKLYKDKVKAKVKGNVNYMYHVISYSDHGDVKIDYEIKLGENYITDITFSRSSNGDIISAGFYSKKGLSSIDGSFFMTLDPITKAVKASNLKEFDLDFMTEYMTEKEEKKTKKNEEKGKDSEMYQYDLRSLVKREDGGAMLIGEQFFVNYVSRPCGNGSYCTTTYYYYNDIIVVNIDPSGKIEWAKKIPKRQMSINDGGYYSSFAMAVNKDKLYFVYNDDEASLDSTKMSKRKYFTIGGKNTKVVAIATLDFSGKLTREILIDTKEIEVVIRPKVCEQIDDEHMLLFGERKKKEQFAVVTFN